VFVSAGHGAATYEQLMAAVGAGCTRFTHLFNAMSQLDSRDPGMVGAALDTPATFAGLTVDGIHVHPASLRIAWTAKGADRLFLVTDAMSVTGTDLPGWQCEKPSSCCTCPSSRPRAWRR
jgi:N-acetylglucosamine-6-phosphate deacetylase